MLIKLGNIWVDPEKVMCLEPCQSEPTTLIWLPGTPDDCVGADIPIDEAAEAINRALSDQKTGTACWWKSPDPPLPGPLDPVTPEGGDPPELTRDERAALLAAWDHGNRWIARDSYGWIWVSQTEPVKVSTCWAPASGSMRQLTDMTGQFRWLSWTDGAATPISWLLGIKEAGGE